MPSSSPPAGKALSHLFVALLLAPLALFSAITFWSDYTREVRRSEDMARAVAQAADERISGSLRTVDLLLQYVADSAAHRGLDQDATLGRVLAFQARSMPEIDLMLIADRSGRRRVASDEDERFQDVAPEQFFEVQRMIHAARRVVIDGPIADGRGGVRIVVSRPVLGRGGAFLGIVAAVLKPGFFTEPLAQIAPERVQAATLFNSNGVVLSRYPERDGWIGRSFADTLLFRQPEGGQGAGVWRSGGEGDGVDQVVAWRAIEKYPLTVAAGTSHAVILAAWWSSTEPKLLIEAGLLMLLGYIGLLLRRRELALARTAQDLVRLNAELEERVAERTSSLAQEVAERRRIEGELLAAKEAAEAGSRAKTRFLAVASHDLRQPVQALALYANVLAGRALDPSDAAVVDRLRRSAASVSGLLESLLDLSKLDAGVVHPDRRPVPLGTVLERLWQDCCPEAEAAGVSLSVVATGLWVRSDPALLDRILQNLVGNAVRYTPAGGKVLVGCRRRAGRLVVEVRDTGIGIPAERQAEIFEEFIQLLPPGQERRQGLGLGLAIVRRLAALLGHPLALVSVVGRGSCFSVDLGPPAAPLPAGRPGAPCTGMVRRGADLLVVDDDDAVRHGLALQLAAWGFTVAAAAGAEAARTLLPAGGLDGLIADFRLGGETTGIALARDLAARNRRPLAVLLLTGDTEPERLREASDSGFRLLHKPAGPDDLYRMLLGDPGEGAQGGDRHPFGLGDAGPTPPSEGETSSG